MSYSNTFVFFFLLLVISGVSATQGIETIAANNKTGECGEFWPGDEYIRYELKEGWKEGHINYDSGLLQVGESQCNLSYGLRWCCESLGYKFIGKAPARADGIMIGLGKGDLLVKYGSWPWAILIIFLFIFLIIKMKRAKGTAKGSH